MEIDGKLLHSMGFVLESSYRVVDKYRLKLVDGYSLVLHFNNPNWLVTLDGGPYDTTVVYTVEEMMKAIVKKTIEVGRNNFKKEINNLLK